MTGYEIADLSVSIIICGLLLTFIILKIKKKFVWFAFTFESVLLLLFGFLHMDVSFYVTLALFIVTMGVTLFTNIQEVKKLFAVSVQRISVNNKSLSKDDKQKLITNITTAVQWLSDNKTGALITFERSVSLDKYIDSGTVINCPITPEILETIFYEGTRLHDGAVIIRGDLIVAASVFFTSTTKNLVGKYGARHRAALGISESSDALTIVVSEETGRISLAYGGTLETVKYDDFERVFTSFIIPSNNFGLD